MTIIRTMIFASMLTVLLSCGNKQAQASGTPVTQPETAVDIDFDADSAYAYIKSQTDFGPRVPGTPAWRACGEWLVSTLNALGAQDIKEQRGHVTAYDGTRLDINNISARFNPEAKKRVLLLSHYDSRPWADHDPDPTKRHTAIDGANDGASGVGVILEIARQISKKAPRIGVDVLFVDAEDYGPHNESDYQERQGENMWALGTQYWVQQPTIPLNEISYAILLDMVGGKNAVFPREYFSQRSAGYVNDKVWSAASKAGYSNRFTSGEGAPVVDDHIPLLQGGVPAIDIVESNNPSTGSFNPTWHTVNDNIDNIDKATLKAVGQTLIQLIYTE